MAQFSLDLRTIKRSQQRSVVAAAAYRSATKIEDKRSGMIHDFTKKKGVARTILLAADKNGRLINPHAGFADRLWNSAEAAEVRSNAVVGRELVISLPHEFSDAQRESVSRQMGVYMVERFGVAVMAAIHLPDRTADARNHHLHMLFSTRRVIFDLDQRLFAFGEKTRELDDRKLGSEMITEIRTMWEKIANAELASVGASIDRRSLVERGLSRPARVHLGPNASALERKGIKTRLGDHNRAVDNLVAAQAEVDRIRAEEKAAAIAKTAKDQADHDEAVKQAARDDAGHQDQAARIVREALERTEAKEKAAAKAAKDAKNQADRDEAVRQAARDKADRIARDFQARRDAKEKAAAEQAKAQSTPAPRSPITATEPPKAPTKPEAVTTTAQKAEETPKNLDIATEPLKAPTKPEAVTKSQSPASKSPGDIEGLPKIGLFLTSNSQPMIRFYVYLRLHGPRPEIRAQLLDPNSRLRKLFEAVKVRLAPIMSQIEGFLAGDPRQRQQAADALLARPPALDQVEKNLRDTEPVGQEQGGQPPVRKNGGHGQAD